MWISKVDFCLDGVSSMTKETAFYLSLHANFSDLLIQPVSKFESTASIGYAVTQIKWNWSSTETDKLILFLQKFPVTKTVRVSTLHITYS